MDQPHALDFVFGGTVTRDDWEEADHEERRRLVETHLDLRVSDETIDDRDVALLLRLAIVEQLVSNHPPEAWATAQRLAAGGMDRDEIIGQLTIVLVHALRASLGDSALADDIPPPGMRLADLAGTDQPSAPAATTTDSTITSTIDLTDPTIDLTTNAAGNRTTGPTAGLTADPTTASTTDPIDLTDPAADLAANPAPTDPAPDPTIDLAADPTDPATTPPADLTTTPVTSASGDDAVESEAVETEAAVGDGVAGAPGPGLPTASTDTRYLGWIAELPLPDSQRTAEALQEIAAAAKALPTDELVARTLERLGYSRGNQPVQRYVERIEEYLAALTDEGPITWLPGGRTVHVASLTDGIVLTHRLTADEHTANTLSLGFDLAGLMRIDAPVHDGVELDVDRGPVNVEALIDRQFRADAIKKGREPAKNTPLPQVHSGEAAWVGPTGWLDRFTPGTVLAIRVVDGDADVAPDADTALDADTAPDAGAGPSSADAAPVGADTGPFGAAPDADSGAVDAEAETDTAPNAVPDAGPSGADVVSHKRDPGRLSVGADARPARRRTIYIEALPEVPPVDATLVAALRRAYDHAVDEPVLPVSGEELVLGVLAADPSAFDTPQAPLTDLVEAAGLQRRHSEVAHDPVVWAQARVVAYMHDVMDRTDDRRVSRAAVEVLTDVAHITEGVPVDLARRRSSLNHLRDPEVLGIVADEFLDVGASADEARRFAAELLDAAHGSPQASTARYIAALAAERAGELDVAEQQLELAVEADTHNLAAIDRLAWYASDRGDAPRAVALWRRSEAAGEVVGDVRIVEPYATSALGTDVGRNDPCWCGSGRKHKHCHLGVVPQLPVRDRVPWLCQKALDYLRRSRAGRTDVVSVAYALTVEGDNVRETLADPLAMDLALVEGGWFGRFLSARGELLPDDEAELAAEWLTVPRSVYEVLAVDAAAGVTVKDMRSGDEIDLWKPTFAGYARRGDVWCGRAVPVGDAHHFLGAFFEVSPDEDDVDELLATLDDGDPDEIARWRATVIGCEREDEAKSGGPPPTDEDMFRIRDRLEERWCDEPHADLDGLTPREAAADPTHAEQLDQVIAAVENEAAPPPMDIVNKRPTRLRELLGLEPTA